MKRPFIFIFFCSIVLSLLSIFSKPLPSIDSEITTNTDIICSGTVYRMEEKAESTALYLKNIQILSINNTNKRIKNPGITGILVYAKEVENIKVDNVITVHGTIEKFTKGTNPGQFNEFIYYKSMKLDYKIYGDKVEIQDVFTSKLAANTCFIKNKLKASAYRYLTEETAGTICAMLLGDKSGLPAETKELYQKNGIAHILAISGLHISFLGLALFAILKKFYIPNEVTIPVTIAFLFWYGYMTGFSVSTNRAVIMLGLSLLSILLGRTYDFITAACLSGTIILLQSPYQLLNCGFLLSFGAILAIASLYPCMKIIFISNKDEEKVCNQKNGVLHLFLLRFNKNKIKEQTAAKTQKKFKQFKQKLFDSILVSGSINIITFPIILFFYYDIPIYSIFLNLIILALIGFLVSFGGILSIGGISAPMVGALCSYSVESIFFLYDTLCKWCLSLPFSIVTLGRPTLWQIAIYYWGILFFCVAAHFQKRILGWICLGISILCLLLKIPSTGVEITVFDVGQGDGILIEQNHEKTYFIDGGSSSVKQVGKYRLIPALKSKGISSLNYAIVTHTDADHISGITEVLENTNEPGMIKLEHLILPDINNDLIDESYLELIQLAEQKEIPIIYLKKGDLIQQGAFKLECLHPYKEFATTEKNAYSTVLRMDYHEFSMLFTGDISDEGEVALLQNENLGECDIYKVAHHGSKYTNSEELLQKLLPKFAIISAGAGNRYGHPHQETLDRLKETECTAFSTIDYGTIIIRSNGYNTIIEGRINNTNYPWAYRKKLGELQE